MAKNTQKNALPCNRAARKEYEKRNFKRQTILFKNEELFSIEQYCLENNVPKNTFFREACMQHLENLLNK